MIFDFKKLSEHPEAEMLAHLASYMILMTKLEGRSGKPPNHLQTCAWFMEDIGKLGKFMDSKEVK